MRLFFVTSAFPIAGHTVRAPTVVVREALTSLRALGHEVDFQPLLGPGRDPRPTAEEKASIEWAGRLGIRMLSTLQAPPASDAQGGSRELLRLALARDPAHAFPACKLTEQMAERVATSDADAVFNLWSSAALAACSAVDRPVFAYYGNPDHKPTAARLKYASLFGTPARGLRPRLYLALRRAANRATKRANIALMRTATWATNVCAVDAQLFADHGHPNAFYIQNMWPRPGLVNHLEAEPNKIVGNIGGLYATGNTFGLSFLGREVLPALDRRLGRDFSIHLYGAGELLPSVAAGLRHPGVHQRGWVEDIDGELASAKVFLLLNNNNLDFIVGHTRILHAWSLGSCLVAHANNALAMPEIVHGENALLGESGEEIAELVATALEDEELRQRIVAGGRETFERLFLPDVVMNRVVQHLESGVRPTLSSRTG